jgi:1-deoxy-D-xylulose 5-phosphate reductoisomerase
VRAITVLGSTGSVGRRTLELVPKFPDEFRVAGLAARGSNLALVKEQVEMHRPTAVALLDGLAVDRLARELPTPRPELLAGPEGLATLAAEVPADVVVSALVGGAGLLPTLAAIRAGRTVALGAKITIDSATLMNKGLEVIEAHWLFGMSFDRVDVVVHPQSIVHSLVEFIDGSVLAQLGMPDMGIPILYALSFPDRLPCPAPTLDLVQVGMLTFESPDPMAFPCLALARQAGLAGGAAPVVLNAANEVAVAGFLDGRCGFTDIPRLIADALDAHAPAALDDLEACLEIDGATRRWVETTLACSSVGLARS